MVQTPATDTSQKTNEKWVQSLAMLYQACEPLTYDCIRTEEETNEIFRNIGKHVYECSRELDAIKNGNTQRIDPSVPMEWLQSLALLYEACEQLLTFCLHTKEEEKAMRSEIERKTYYCTHVKLAIQDSEKSTSWDDWSDKESRFDVFVSAHKPNEFAEDLKRAFDGDR